MKAYASLMFLLLAALGPALCPSVGADTEKASGLAIKVDPDQIDFLIGKELITRYHKGPKVAKPYCWPVNGPGGVKLTRAWPMEEAGPGGTKDHVHQKSAWFCHGDVIPEGVALSAKIKGVEGVDFWSEAKGHGRIVCTAVGEPELGPHQSRITTKNDWLTAEGVKILGETRTITLYDLGQSRLFVFDIDLHASECPVTFGDTKEGSFGVRVNDVIREKGGKGKLENAEGKTGMLACWGRLSAWCDYSGPIDGKTVGLTIFDDPANLYPACWHSRDYGLMAANPFGRAKSGFPAMKGRTDLVKLEKGKHLVFRYGLLLHPGDAKEGKVAEQYKKFVELRKQKDL